MSNFQTHMVIGAVGGLGLVRAVDHFMPGFISNLIPGQPPLLAEAMIIAVSVVSATVPDIDEPNSWLSQRIQKIIFLVGIVVCGALGLQMHDYFMTKFGVHWSVVVIMSAIAGGVLGWSLGWLFPRAIRAGAGGHRAGTHSLFFGGAMLLVAAVFSIMDWGIWVLLPLIFAWGWFLHILGDIVTPAGWKPFAPVSNYAFRLPRSIARYGERIALWTATLLGVALLLIR